MAAHSLPLMGSRCSPSQTSGNLTDLRQTMQSKTSCATCFSALLGTLQPGTRGNRALDEAASLSLMH